MGFRSYITTTLNARAVFHCEEASGNLINDGPIGNDLVVAGTPVYAVADSVTYESGKAITFDGSTDYFSVGTGVDHDTGGTGTIIVFARLPVGKTGGLAYGMGNTGGATALFTRLINTEIAIKVQRDGSSDYLAKLTGQALDDNEWRLLCFVQPGGGVGVDLYVNAVKTAWTTEVATNLATLDEWFDDVHLLSTQYTVGASPDNGHVQKFEGDISVVAITRTVMSQAQVTTLWNLTTGASGVTSTTRRTGRRTYNDAL